jgi:hypothetical protein
MTFFQVIMHHAWMIACSHWSLVPLATWDAKDTNLLISLVTSLPRQFSDVAYLAYVCQR